MTAIPKDISGETSKALRRMDPYPMGPLEKIVT